MFGLAYVNQSLPIRSFEHQLRDTDMLGKELANLVAEGEKECPKMPMRSDATLGYDNKTWPVAAFAALLQDNTSLAFIIFN